MPQCGNSIKYLQSFILIILNLRSSHFDRKYAIRTRYRQLLHFTIYYYSFVSFNLKASNSAIKFVFFFDKLRSTKKLALEDPHHGEYSAAILVTNQCKYRNILQLHSVLCSLQSIIFLWNQGQISQSSMTSSADTRFL